MPICHRSRYLPSAELREASLSLLPWGSLQVDPYWPVSWHWLPIEGLGLGPQSLVAVAVSLQQLWGQNEEEDQLNAAGVLCRCL